MSTRSLALVLVAFATLAPETATAQTPDLPVRATDPILVKDGRFQHADHLLTNDSTQAISTAWGGEYQVAQSDGPRTTPSSAIRLDELTVPADQLPAGCAISPANAVSGGGHRVRSGLWPGLPSNPWRGTDANVIAMMQEVIVAMPRMPSQVTQQDVAQFRLRLADSVEEGYGAAYSDGVRDLIVVYAVRYAEGVTPLPGRPETLASAQVVARVIGGDRPCARPITAHVRSVMGL